MATITAQVIVDRAEIILQDTTNVRWLETELLGWLNDGQREIVLLKPDSYTVNESVVLVAGTKQAIPATGIQLIDIVRNMGTTPGTTAGNAIRVISREVLDATNPAWHTEAAAAAVKHFMFDPRDPKRFYVWPKSDATNFIEIVYSASPANVAIGATILLDDVYAGALLDYVLYRAYSKDAQFAANKDRAVGHYGAFSSALGVKNQAQTAANPNVSQMPFNPNVPAGAK